MVTIPAGIWLYKLHHPSVAELQQSAEKLHDSENGNENDSENGNDNEEGSEAKNIEIKHTQIKDTQAKYTQAKYLLIGGGAASFAAMEAIREQEPTADILIVTAEEHAPYMRPPLSKELWFNQDDTASLRFTDWHGNVKPIAFQPMSFFETTDVTEPSLLVRMLTRTVAVKVDPDSKTVVLKDGRLIGYEKLLLATGGTPRTLDLVNHSVSTFRTVDDFQRMHEIAKTADHIVIVGGGFIGSEMAIALAAFSHAHEKKLQITQIFPEDGNMGLIFPRYLSTWTTGHVRKEGVRVLPNTHVAMIETVRDGNPALKLSDGQTLVADHVIVAVGIDPNDEIAKTSGLAVDPLRGRIVTDANMQVSRDIFAAGDVISFPDRDLGMQRRIEHYDHAILSGKVAGRNMVASGSQPLEPYKNQSMFWSDLGPEVGFEAVGLVDNKLTTVGVWARSKGTEDMPKGTSLDPSDIRVQPVGQTSSRSIDPSTGLIPAPASDPNAVYDKGLVLYAKDRKIVGVLLFNLFNRVPLARDIISEGRTLDEVSLIVQLFNISE